MADLQGRVRIGLSPLRMLVGALLALSLLGAAFSTTAAQVPGFDENGMPPGFDENGMPPGFDENGNPPAVENQGPSPEEMCYAVFPDGIITGDPWVGDIDCSFFFPSEPAPEPPPPAPEPTKTPDHDDGKDHDDDKDHGHDHDKDHGHDHDKDKKHEDEKKDVGGKAAPVVTTMPSTGTGAAADSSAVTSGVLGVVAIVLASLALAASRLGVVRIRR